MHSGSIFCFEKKIGAEALHMPCLASTPIGPIHTPAWCDEHHLMVFPVKGALQIYRSPALLYHEDRDGAVRAAFDLQDKLLYELPDPVLGCFTSGSQRGHLLSI